MHHLLTIAVKKIPCEGQTLHSDAGGNDAAIAELNSVRDKLKEYAA